MVLEKSLKAGKKFGSRYGRRIRHIFSRIEHEQKRLHKCPYCNAQKVKRVAAGIWQCRKCDAKFTGKAYTLHKKIKAEEMEKAPEEEVEEKEEKEEEPEDEEGRIKPTKYKEPKKDKGASKKEGKAEAEE